MRPRHDPDTPQRPRLRWADAAWVLPVVLAGHALVLGALLQSEPGQAGGVPAWTALFQPTPATPRAAGPGAHAPSAVPDAAPKRDPGAERPAAGPSPFAGEGAGRGGSAGSSAAVPLLPRGEDSKALASRAPVGVADSAPLPGDVSVPERATAEPERAAAERTPGPAWWQPDPRMGALGEAATPPASGPAAPAAASVQGDEPLPTYAVRVPPGFVQRYALRRGGREGRADLVLTRDGPRYAMSLRGWADGAEVLGQDSRGGFDGAGFAPERFVERQRGRDRLAANFDATRRRISYSGPARTHPYAPGTQDRLSWLVQLAAIVGAEPARFAPGAELVLAVSGARADLDRWRFEVGPPEALALADGRVVAALPLRREPARPYDLRVQVWLDPANHHLPALVRLSVVPGGAALELLAEPDEPAAPAGAPLPAASAGGG